MGRFTPEYRHSSCARGFSHVQTFGGVYVLLLLIALPSFSGDTVDIPSMSKGLRVSRQQPDCRCDLLQALGDEASMLALPPFWTACYLSRDGPCLPGRRFKCPSEDG